MKKIVASAFVFCAVAVAAVLLLGGGQGGTFNAEPDEAVSGDTKGTLSDRSTTGGQPVASVRRADFDADYSFEIKAQEDAESLARVQLDGALSATVFPRSTGYQVVYVFRELRANVRLDGVEEGALEPFWKEPVVADVDGQGRVVDLLMTPNAPSIVRGVFRDLVAKTQLVGRDSKAKTWTVRERDPAGEYTVAYTRASPYVIRKRRKTYVKVITPQGLLPALGRPAPRMKIHNVAFRLDDEVLPVSIEARESSVTDTGVDSASTFIGQTALTLRRTAIDPAPGAALPTGRLVSVGLLTDHQQFAEAETAASASSVAGASAPELMELVLDASSKADGRAAVNAAVRLGHLLRLQPSLVEDVVARIKAKPDETRHFLSALAVANHDTAKNGIADLAADAELPTDLRLDAANALNIAVDIPVQAQEVLSELASDVTNIEVRDGARLALGATARDQRARNGGRPGRGRCVAKPLRRRRIGFRSDQRPRGPREYRGSVCPGAGRVCFEVAERGRPAGGLGGHSHGGRPRCGCAVGFDNRARSGSACPAGGD